MNEWIFYAFLIGCAIWMAYMMTFRTDDWIRINAQHREENFQAAENAYRELVVEQERAKRRAVHANAPAKPPGKPEDKKEDKGTAKPKDQGKGE